MKIFGAASILISLFLVGNVYGAQGLKNSLKDLRSNPENCDLDNPGGELLSATGFKSAFAAETELPNDNNAQKPKVNLPVKSSKKKEVVPAVQTHSAVIPTKEKSVKCVLDFRPNHWGVDREKLRQCYQAYKKDDFQEFILYVNPDPKPAGTRNAVLWENRSAAIEKELSERFPDSPITKLSWNRGAAIRDSALVDAKLKADIPKKTDEPFVATNSAEKEYVVEQGKGKRVCVINSNTCTIPNGLSTYDCAVVLLSNGEVCQGNPKAGGVAIFGENKPTKTPGLAAAKRNKLKNRNADYEDSVDEEEVRSAPEEANCPVCPVCPEVEEKVCPVVEEKVCPVVQEKTVSDNRKNSKSFSTKLWGGLSIVKFYGTMAPYLPATNSAYQIGLAQTFSQWDRKNSLYFSIVAAFGKTSYNFTYATKLRTIYYYTDIEFLGGLEHYFAQGNHNFSVFGAAGVAISQRSYILARQVATTTSTVNTWDVIFVPNLVANAGVNYVYRWNSWLGLLARADVTLLYGMEHQAGIVEQTGLTVAKINDNAPYISPSFSLGIQF